MLGIIIGIMSIITIVIIGDALTASVSGSLSSLGTNNINLSVQERSIQENNRGSGGGPPGMQFNVSTSGKTPTSDDLISDQMIADMMSYFSNEIQRVSLSYSGGNATVRDGDLYANVTISGTNADFLLANNVELLSGRLTSDDDLSVKGMTAVVSDRLVYKMFPDAADPIGQQIKLFKPNSIELYTIIGVYRFEQSVFMGSMVADEDMATTFYVPLTTAKQDLLEKNFT